MRDAGINAYTAKPVGQRELFDAIAIAMAHEAILCRAPRRRSRARSPRPSSPLDERRSIRVLLVEDNFLNMKLTMSQLQKLGYEADSVANGKEAVEALRANRLRRRADGLPDAGDGRLPGHAGDPPPRKRAGRRHRIIAMTANALEGDREKCLAAGMDDYLAKPTRHEELERALARFYRCRRSIRRARVERGSATHPASARQPLVLLDLVVHRCAHAQQALRRRGHGMIGTSMLCSKSSCPAARRRDPSGRGTAAIAPIISSGAGLPIRSVSQRRSRARSASS